MANIEAAQDLAKKTQDDFQLRMELSSPSLKRAFGYALNSIHNGWNAESNPTLKPTTEILLREADALTASGSKFRNDYLTTLKISDPRIKYQVALELNKELGGSVSKKIFSLAMASETGSHKTLRDMGFVDMLEAGLIYRGADQARMSVDPGFKPSPLSRSTTNNCEIRMIAPNGKFAIGYCDVNGESTPIVAMFPERPKK